MKIGVLPYLTELAQRFGEIAKECSDPRAAFDLKSLSIEIANKAHDLGKAFTVSSPGSSREQV